MEKSKNRFWMHDIVQSVRETFNEQRCLCLCLSCYWFWQLFYFQSPGFVSAPHVSGRLLTLAASAVVYALALRWGKKHLAIVASRPYYLWAVGVLIAGGTVCQGMAFGPLDGDMARAVDHAGACAVGIGAALFVIEGGRLCVQVGPRRSLVVIVIGLFGSTLLFVIALLGGAVVRLALLVIAAAASTLLLERASLQIPKSRLYDGSLETKLNVPKKLLCACFMQGLALGMMTEMGLSFAVREVSPAVFVCSFAVGAATILTATRVLDLDFNHLLFEVGFPLMGMGFLLYACLPADVGLASFAFTVSHCFTWTIVTCICAYFGKCLKCSACWIVSLTTLALVVGQLAGMMCIDSGVALAGSRAQEVSISWAMVLAFSLPTLGLILLSNDNAVSGWGAIRPGDRPSDDDALFSKIASDYGLTNRETEIAQLLSRGRNKRYISEQLGVAEETVKTHMGNLYRKLLIHSQQEIIDLVERERAARDR